MTFNSHARHWLPALPLIALLAATYWLNQQIQPDSARRNNGKEHTPDAIMENFSAVKMDEQGAPHFIVNAKKLLHYPDDDSTALEVPRITALSPGKPAIHTIAKRGIVSSKGDELFLYDDVEVLREASKDRSELTLQTEYLHVIPEKDLADTDRHVTVIDARNNIQATGMLLDNKAHTVKLLSHVRSVHVPPKK